jgi:hypothetical protein
MAITAQAPGATWGRWNEQSQVDLCYMDMSGVLQSLDPRATTSAGLTRPILTPAYVTTNNYSGASSNMLNTSQQFHQNISPYGYTSFSNGTSTTILPTYGANYIQQRALPRLTQYDGEDMRDLTMAKRSTPRGFITETQSPSPSIKPEKPELMWKAPRSSESYVSPVPEASKTISSNIRIDGTNEPEFGTEVDTLMKMIQSKAQDSSAQPDSFNSEDQSMPLVGVPCVPPYFQSSTQRSKHEASGQHKLTFGELQEEKDVTSIRKKRFRCTVANCKKRFLQKTHLEIHQRSHNGATPYVSTIRDALLLGTISNNLKACRFPDCNRSFSQQGNLRVSYHRITCTLRRLTEIPRDRLMREDILAKNHSPVPSATKDSVNEAMLPLTKSCMIIANLITANSMIAENNLHNGEISRCVKSCAMCSLLSCFLRSTEFHFRTRKFTLLHKILYE